MKNKTVLFSYLLLISLSTSCNKAKQIQIISAQTWVVTEISNTSDFARVGDEFTFHDNRLFFKYSNGAETDGQWRFSERDAISSPNVEVIYLYSDFGDYDFDIINWTEEELELNEPNINGFYPPQDLTVHLKPKE